MSSNLFIALQGSAPSGLRDYKDITNGVRQKTQELEKLDVLGARFLAATENLIAKYDGQPDLSDRFDKAMEGVKSGYDALFEKRKRLEGEIKNTRSLYPIAFS